MCRKEWKDFALVEIPVQVATGRQKEKEGPTPWIFYRVQGIQEAGETPRNEFAIAKRFRNGSPAEGGQVRTGPRKKEEMKFDFSYVVSFTLII